MVSREARCGTGTHFSPESETLASKVVLLPAGRLVRSRFCYSIAKSSPNPVLTYSDLPQSGGGALLDRKGVSGLSLHSREERGWDPMENKQVMSGKRFRRNQERRTELDHGCLTYRK